MSHFPRASRQLLRQPSIAIPRVPSSSLGPVAHLHQKGPARSAVVHEQALPQAQTQIPPVKAAPSSQAEPANIDTLISQIPLVQSLRAAHKTYKETRPHLAIPPPIRRRHFVGGSLAGSGKLAFQPYMWTSSTPASQQETSPKSGKGTSNSNVTSIFHIGRDLCGHPGFVHGGLLTVLFDEVFARCVSASFPSGLGMTANLNVDFRKPALPDRLYILRAETVKVEGRKAWVEGRMTYLPLPLAMPSDFGGIVPDTAGALTEESDGAVMVAEGRALFVEPKFADVST
ncbi:hypothetical protein N7474_002696 [Penicillium riverlandense]|uniref:uncharacterized protein n=1 Tax=Penicillium riverlandense TaxID=1903569 RepID=UPI002546F8F6|nr:uncharacterized protein N7474_002696 [Penicillium riverlandense]KAJ5825558.1 hypothetical protein N7474_002696 [Penicillium riverlandense]